ncbi:HlyC/CorC family transporter [Atopobacter sp. AH10]|uniref:hemolysin family protein n=1 Tax=Atopobacter sp. AH10 TaxID=2315861 RepID=UPI000EF184C8|nr:hemolysin family protein [Atopobacter sp. AH10]RLK62887.1 HlyC/CorC family transporter [Atopobacter sp. AH10]
MEHDPGASSLSMQLLIIAILTLLNAFFAASEIAFVSLNQPRMSRLAQEGDKKAKRVMKLLGAADDFLATIQVAITFAGFFSSAAAATTFVHRLTPLLKDIPAASQVATVIVTMVLSYVSLVFGELYPKQLALQMPEKIALSASGVILVVQKLFRPFVWLLSVSTGLLKKITPIEFSQKEEKLTRNEMKALLANSRNDGAIDLEEFTMMQGVLSLDAKLAREVMVPRTDALMLDCEDSIQENMEIILNCPYSRLPVFEEDKDNVIGVIHTKDILKAGREKGFDAINIKEIMNEPLFVPSMIYIDDLMIEFRKEHQHMAILRDEYGGVEGLVTLEDLLEEIVGDIEDEYDQESDECREIDENHYVIDGRMTIEDFARYFEVKIDSDEVDTMAGYMLEGLGYFPDEDEPAEVQVGDYSLTPMVMENGRIKKISVAKMEVGINGEESPSSTKADE